MKKRFGFTLLELLVVIIILGILAGLAIPKFMTGVESARVAEATRALAAIREAQEVMYDVTGGYINADIANLGTDIRGMSSAASNETHAYLKYWVITLSPGVPAATNTYNAVATRLDVSSTNAYTGKTIVMNENGYFIADSTHPMRPKND